MNTESDQFEKRLSQQPLRQVPPQWREEILAVASRESSAERREQRQFQPSFLSTLNSRLSTILWPHPVAWAGLAAVWVFIFAVEFSTHDRTTAVAQGNSTPPVEVIIQVRQQQKLLAELLGPRETRDADRQKIFVPRPRSEHSEISIA